MKKLSITKGFSVVTAIIIIAIVSIGGYTAVRYSQETQVEMEMKKADIAMLAESKAKIKLGLENLQQTLNSDIGLDAKVEATTGVISDLKADIKDTQDSLSRDSSDQLEALDDQLTQLAVEIKLNEEAAIDTLGNIIEDINTSATIEGEASTETSTEGTSMTTEENTELSDDTLASSTIETETQINLEVGN